jgi:hypothetical protein
VEEFDLGVNNGHPPEILLEKQKESKQGFTPDHYRGML